MDGGAVTMIWQPTDVPTAPTESVMRPEKVKVPVAVGVPVMTPVFDTVNPVGSAPLVKTNEVP